MSATPNYPAGVANIAAQITYDTNMAPVVLYDNVSGTKSVTVTRLSVCSDDAAAKAAILSLKIGEGATYFPAGYVAVPAGAGTGATNARVVGLSLTTAGSLNEGGIYTIDIAAGSALYATPAARMSNPGNMTFTGAVRKYE